MDLLLINALFVRLYQAIVFVYMSNAHGIFWLGVFVFVCAFVASFFTE